MLRWVARLAPLAVILLALGLRVWDPGFVAQFRLLVFDAYQRLLPRPADPATSPVIIVEIDDASLRRLGQWPWPRTRMAQLVDRLRAAGAVAVGFDMVFAEPDRTSPKEVIRMWPRTKEIDALRAEANKLPDHDKQFAEAIARLPTVLAFVLVNRRTSRPPSRNAAYGYAGDDPAPFVPALPGAVVNLALLEAAASGNGAINWIPDADQIVRRVPTVLRLGERLYPSFFAEVLRVVQRSRGYKIRSSNAGGATAFGEKSGLNAVQIGRAVVPVDANGLMSVYFARHDTRRYIPAWKVLAGDPASLARLRGRIVLIGASAAGLFDLRATPLAPAIPGVEVHAQAIEQVIAGIHLLRPDFALGVELFAILLLCLVIVMVVPRVGPLWGAIVGGVALYAALIGAWYAFVGERLLIDGVYPALTVIAVFIVTTVLAYTRTEREKRAVRGAFGRYLSPSLVEELANHPERLVLGGEMREMTVLFSDIRGFTALSEKFDAQGLTRFMNRYLTPMTDVILARGGTVDKYMGDAIMAFWNAPLDDVEHADHACRAALDMLGRLADLNAVLSREAPPAGGRPITVQIGIGINTGACCVGNMGSDQRFDYSVLGDDVNLASRLEGQCKTYGVPILIGEATQADVPHLATLEVDLIRVKGRNAPARIHALMGDEALAGTSAFRELAAAQTAFHEAYRAQRWADALTLLETCRQLGGADLRDLHDLFSARIRAYRQRSPGPDWDGVYIAETK